MTRASSLAFAAYELEDDELPEEATPAEQNAATSPQFRREVRRALRSALYSVGGLVLFLALIAWLGR